MAVSHEPSAKTYSLLMRVEAANTPAAVSKLRRKLSDLQDKHAIEMASPTSGKRLRFLDTASESFTTQREAGLNLRQRTECLESEMKDLRNKMQDFALESKINCGQAQGTKDNPGVVGNIAHTVKAEAHTAKVEAHTAKVEAQTAKAEARTAKAEAQTAKAEAHTATAEAQAAKEKVDTLAKDLEKFQHHYWTICRGEIVSAAMVLLGYSPNGRYTKTGFVRHVQKNLAEYLLFVQDKLPGITPSEFQNMVHILSPQPENHHINSRNSAAHQFSIDQARLSVQGRRYTHLLRWVDMLAAFEKDGNACISDVAFDYAYLCDGKSLEQDELVTSILTALKHASEDDKIEFSRLIGSFRDLQVRQESLENEEDEEALLKASNIPFIPLE